MILSTIDLLLQLKERRYEYFEASFILNYNCRATHFISFRKSFIWDEGIDSQLIKWEEKQFLKLYTNAYWEIN